jgi:hypothetical protein
LTAPIIAAATAETTRDKIIVAAIGAGGGFIGGLVSSSTQYLIEKSKGKSAARAVARVLAGQLEDVGLTLAAIGDGWPATEDLTITPSADDLKTLASRHSEALQAFQAALAHLKSLKMLREAQAPSAEESRKLIKDAREAVADASAALKAVG